MPQKANPELVRNLSPYFPIRGEVFPVIDVTSRQIGAVGNGSTDDTAAIQKALTVANTIGGGIVYLPPYRTYIISSAGVGATDGLIMYANTILMGGGRSSILKMGDGVDLAQIIYGASATGLRVSRLQIDGNNDNQSEIESYGINFVDCTYVEIDDVYVHDITGTSDPLGAGIRISGSSDYDAYTKIIRVLADRNTSFGIEVYQAACVEISDSYANTNGASGIRISGTAGKFTVESTWAVGNEHHGIYITDTTGYSGGIVTGCYFRSNGQASSNTYSGVRIDDCYDLIISNNICSDVFGSAVQKYGIEESGTSDYNLYVNNTLRGNVSGAISESGANNKTAHNMGSATHDV